jgi:FAD/FMN-containing dehydrogenase
LQRRVSGGGDEDAFSKRTGDVNHVAHDSVARFNGSISAEQGLGQYKRALDPLGIMSAGKVL